MATYEGNDIYCDLIIPGKLAVEIVKDTGNILAFHHTRPSWPVHIVVTTRKHISSLLDLPDELELARELLLVVAEVAGEVKDEEGACRVITNLGSYQDSKHLHLHVVSGLQLPVAQT